MKRYFNLYITSLRRSFRGRLEYKSQLFISIFSFFFENICSICAIYFIVTSIPELKVDGQVWSIWQLGFLYGFVMLPMGIDHLFSDEFWLVSYRRVTDGSLDMYFLRPVPVIFQVFAETFQPEGFGELIVGVVMLIFCGLQIQFTWNFGVIFLLIISTIFGALIITSLKIIFASFAFKIKRSGPLFQIVYNFIRYMKYPVNIYPLFLRIIFTFILPFAVFISFPINTLFYQQFDPFLLSLLIIGIAIVFFLLAIFIWNIFIKKYESTGN